MFFVFPQVELSFHEVEYVITVSTIHGDTMCIAVEQKRDASRWKGEFTSKCKEQC